MCDRENKQEMVDEALSERYSVCACARAFIHH